VPVGKPVALSLSSALGSTISYVVESHTSPGPLSLKDIQMGKANHRGQCPLWLSFAVDDCQRYLIIVINTPWCFVRIQNITHIHIRLFDPTHR
jgi:hypothetical protein